MMLMAQTALLVSKDMIVKDVMDKYPISSEIMEAYGLHCVGCHANPHDTIEVGAKYHGMADQEIEAMIKELNDVVSKGGARVKKIEKKPEVSDFRKNPVMLTETAANKVASVLKEQNKSDWGIKVKVLAGGCSGYTYGMELISNPEKDDFVIQSNGVNVFVDKSSAEFLQGVTIDYIETLQASGFKFQNPNAHSSCGCGKSFG